MHVDNIFFIVQLMHTNFYKIVKLLKSFKIIIVAPTCFGLHKPSSGSSQPVLRQSYNVDFGYIYRYLKLSVLWLHICSVCNEGTVVNIWSKLRLRRSTQRKLPNINNKLDLPCYACGSCTVQSETLHSARSTRITYMQPQY